MSDKPVSILAFKGFDLDMKCRGFAFEVGKTYTHEGHVKACESGFHSCEYPLDVFRYYAPAHSVFAVVAPTGEIARHSEDSKIASSSLTVKASIDLPGIIKAAIEFVSTRCHPAEAEHATGDSSASSATGYSSASLSIGENSTSEITPHAEGTPLHAVAIATGYASYARAPEGSAIVCVCRSNETGAILHIRASKIGENGIKPDTWYSLNDAGEFVEKVDS